MTAPVRLRPTRRLGGFCALLGLLWLTSANYNNNLGYLLTYLLAGVGLVASFHTRRQLADLDWRYHSPRPVFAGDSVHLPLEVTNATTVPRWQLRLELPGTEPVSFFLDAGERRIVTLVLEVAERGIHRFGPAVLASTFPLGLFRVERVLPPGWEVRVYPRPAARVPPLPPAPVRMEAGELEFAGFRDYRPGDSPRQIHWKALAKGQGLQSKCFETVQAPTGRRLLDWESLPPADGETRLGWMCRWLLEAEESGLEYGIRLPNRALPPGRGPVHLHACLTLLARFPRRGHG